MCFEMIETQINNATPYPKVTPRDAKDQELAMEIEEYLKMELDRMQFERMNDRVERETYKQGTCFFMVGWDNYASTPITQGELYVKEMPLLSVYPQPGIVRLEDAEYIFVREVVSVDKI